MKKRTQRIIKELKQKKGIRNLILRARALIPNWCELGLSNKQKPQQSIDTHTFDRSKKQVGWKLEPLIIEQLRTLAIRKSPQLDMDVLIDKTREQLNNLYCLESSKNKTPSNLKKNSLLYLIDEKI